MDPVECNSQVLEEIKIDAKKTDFRIKEVSKDITKAATIMTKSLTVLDKIMQDGHPVVAHGIGILNGALALQWYLLIQTPFDSNTSQSKHIW